MALTLDGTNGIVSSGSITTQSSSGVIFSDSSALTAASSPFVLKNRIINGDMRIDQRNAGASVTPSADLYVLDRWNFFVSQSSKLTAQQNAGSVTPPAGFTNYFGLTSSSSYTVLTGDYFGTRQYIEGFNVADLDFGKATAKTITISFWARSSLTGSFGGAIGNSGSSRTYPFSYTISSANTWTYCSVTIPGDTSGTWLTTNGVGIELRFSMGAGTTFSGPVNTWASANYVQPTGSVSVVGTSGATLYITGVQLEVGSTATPFERRLYNQELANCQRYFEKSVSQGTTITANNQSASFPVYSTTVANGVTYSQVRFAVTKRASPTVTTYPYGTATNTGRFSNDVGADFGANSGFVSQASDTFFNISNNSGGTLTTGSQLLLLGNWYASAEL